ncbi:helix-turn-helix domain-containing protein [Streptomyces olivaceoviridis]|uniref:helix-turn-helix domain-containing protein n=1 Tax=Streptomyces olivaceoviridis TaxID=1921 RepID=UPI0033ABF09E
MAVTSLTRHVPAPGLRGSVMDIRVLCGLLGEHGLDPMPLLRSARISPSVLTRSDVVVTRRQEHVFQELFASLTSDRPAIWVESARRYAYPAFEDFGLAMITAPTLRDLRNLVTTLGHGGGEYSSVEGDRLATGLAIDFPRNIDRGTAQFAFRVVREVIGGALFFHDLWRSEFPFVRVEMPIDPERYGLQEIIHAPITRNTGSVVFMWPTALIDQPLPRGNTLLHREYVGRIERDGREALRSTEWDEQVLELLGRSGNFGLCLTEVAEELTLAPRTLQRYLKERGVSFRSLREQARVAAAARMLASTCLPIAEIGRKTGYGEVASFSHAFRRWTGTSPRAYRESHAGS